MQGLLALPARAMLPAPPLRPSSLGLPQQRRARHQQQHAARLQRQQQQRLQPAAALPEALAALEASPVRDVAAAAFAVAGSVALIKFFDTLERHNMIDKVRCEVCVLQAFPKVCVQGRSCRRGMLAGSDCCSPNHGHLANSQPPSPLPACGCIAAGMYACISWMQARLQCTDCHGSTPTAHTMRFD